MLQSRIAALTMTAASPSALCRLLAISSLSLIALTFRLWTPQTDFPQIPCFEWACNAPGFVDWGALLVLGISSLTLLGPVEAARSRLAGAGLAGSLGVLFLVNQHRLQPWAWQFFLLAAWLAVGGPDFLRRGWVLLVLTIYFWSAVSKLDAAFLSDYGPQLIRALKQAAGLRGMATRATTQLDSLATVMLVLGELLLPFLLACRRTRRLGLGFALLMHTLLLLALGPWGLNHSAGVLGWNVVFLVQAVLLFGGREKNLPAEVIETPSGVPNSRGRIPARGFAHAFLAAALVWPALEPWGGCDHWLGWAVYSARSDRAEFRDLEAKAPPGSKVFPTGKALQVRKWSLDSLGVPLLPQHRFFVGIGRALASRSNVAVILLEPPNRWTGHQPTPAFEILTDDALSERAKRFFFNTRPRRLSQAKAASAAGPELR